MAKQTFTTGQVLTAAQMTSLQQTAMGGGAATAKTASYVLTAADAGTTVIMNSGSATTITVNTGLFAAGDTVAIINQGAGVCTITAGTATVSTAASLAMGQNETGELYFLSTSAAIFTENMQAAAGGGKVLQVVNAVYSTLTTITSASYTDTGLSGTITPTLATSKILVLVSQRASTYRAVGQAGAGFQLLRGATVIVAAPSSPYTLNVAAGGATSAEVGGDISFNYLDSPATTSATTYKVQAKPETTAQSSNVVAQVNSSPSMITLMEIGA
jgi:hypothetical protein